VGGSLSAIRKEKQNFCDKDSRTDITLRRDYEQSIKRKSNAFKGLNVAKKITGISVITLISIGIVDLVIGYFGGSVTAMADGLYYFSSAMISFIVLLGLGIAHRPEDKKFHFGYHKVESFITLRASIGTVVIGGIIFFYYYEAMINPLVIRQPVVTMLVLAVVSAFSLTRALQMRSISKKYDPSP
jgi:divalent metal cation (Fe/Co/Zn/Cd) transporter